jgi:putative transposase
MKKRFTEGQIIGFLREAEAGLAVKDLCRRHGFSEASYYLWRSNFGGMSVPDAKRLKQLETENARLAAERWHSKQKGAFEPDGSYLLEVPFSHPQELMMDILRHGAAVEVVTPASLRKSVAEEAVSIAGRYSESSR